MTDAVPKTGNPGNKLPQYVAALAGKHIDKISTTMRCITIFESELEFIYIILKKNSSSIAANISISLLDLFIFINCKFHASIAIHAFDLYFRIFIHFLCNKI